MSDIIIIISLLIVSYITGSVIEKRHYKSIRSRELLYYKQPYVSFAKKTINPKKVKECALVSGSIVIGCDHFKAFLASLKNLFGGNVSAYESCLDRGRREAILRMREQAFKCGANIVINVKLETINLEPIGGKHHHPKVCVLAYGTAIKYDK